MVDTEKTRPEKPDEEKYKREHAEAEKLWKTSQEKYVSTSSIGYDLQDLTKILECDQGQTRLRKASEQRLSNC